MECQLPRYRLGYLLRNEIYRILKQITRSAWTRLSRRAVSFTDPKVICYVSRAVTDLDALVNGVTQWADVVCPGNSRISFFGQQTTGWESGIACYEAGKEDLRKKIKEGHRRATVQVCAHNGDPKWCCQIGVRSLIYPVHNYVDCLNNEVRQSSKF